MGSWRSSRRESGSSSKCAKAAGFHLLAFGFLVAFVLLSGCLEGERAASIPASEAVEKGSVEAVDWAEDAQLVLVSGMEAPAEHPATDREQGDGPVLPSDENVGDGKAPAWTLLFYSEERDNTRSFHVTSLEVEDLGESQPPEQTPEPLPEWGVDSPEAMGIALEDASFREAVLSSGSFVVSTLGIYEDDPAWSLVARSQSAGGVEVMVNAVTGVLMSEEDAG